jgi:hypothetical protein
VSTLVQETPEIVFYGFILKPSTAWSSFTEVELEFLRDINRPVKKDYE